MRRWFSWFIVQAELSESIWWQLIANHQHWIRCKHIALSPKTFPSNSSWFDDLRLISKFATQLATNCKFGKSQGLEHWIRCKDIALPLQTFPHHISWLDAAQWQRVLITNWGELLQISGGRGTLYLCTINHIRERVLYTENLANHKH